MGDKMNYYLDKHTVELILDALESYRAEVKHGSDNGHSYIWDVDEIDHAIDSLNEDDAES